MSVHPIATAFPSGGSTTAATIQAQCASGFPLTIAAAGDITTMDLTGLTVRGVLVCSLALKGLAFVYDSADTTSAHDGVAVLVSADGKRFKSGIVPEIFVNVISHTVSAQPAAPAEGDRYALPAAPTGTDWATHAYDLAVYAGGAWHFVIPEEGFITWSEAAASLIHMAADGTWTLGTGAAAVPAGSVGATELEYPWGPVVQTETATPPGGTPAATLKWIVGAAATGVWATHDGEVAEANGAGGWIYYEPYDGALVFDLAADVSKRYDSGSGAWVASGGAWVDYQRQRTADTSSTSSGGTAGYVWSASTAPTNSAFRRSDNVGISIAAPAGVKLRFTYRFTVETWMTADGYFGAGSKNLIAALFRDSEVNCIDWQMTGITGAEAAAAEVRGDNVTFEVTSLDASTHTYKVGLLNATDTTATASYRPATISRRAFTCEVNRD